LTPLLALCLAAIAVGAGCGKDKPAPLYEKVAVERETIVVSASAAGAIEPVRTVDVKSKASGEIIQMAIETGDDAKAGDLLARIDPREPRNTLAQAQARLEVARAQLTTATAQSNRADTLLKSQAITEAEHENARLAYVSAKSSLVQAQSDLETAKDQMADTEIRAPIAGTVLAKNVELGTVISSPTRDVGGGTVLLRMANLDTVQIRALVDETDVGKVQPGLPATITVDAFPNRRFDGAVLKIEPQATVQQNVTMFPVLVRIGNPDHLLKPGMNTEVEIHVGRRENVLTIPYSALRTSRDVASAASVLGLDPEEVQKQVGAGRRGGRSGEEEDERPGGGGPDSAGGADGGRERGGPGDGGGGERDTAVATGAAGGAGRDSLSRSQAAGSEEQARAAMEKRRRGEELSPEEQRILRQFFSQSSREGSRGGSWGRQSLAGSGGEAGRYIVFALRAGKPEPVEIRTGLTDLDVIEVTEGLAENDTVLVLPSASLVTSQQQMRERVQRMTGGGGIPGMQQQQPSGERQRTQ
jgi:HlyD family secretion protein